MRTRFIVLFVLFAVSAGLLWSDFYSGYSEKDRQTLAESYYLAGAQYVRVGKTELGKDYQALAFKIYPQLSPGQITEEKLPSAQELLSQGLAKVIGAPAQGPSMVPRSFFLRYMGALLDEDPAEVVSFLDGSVYLSDEKSEMTRQEAQSAYADLFASEHLGGLEPAELYDLTSLSISAAPQPVQKRWGESSVLRVHAKKDLSDKLAFWKEDQQFLVRKVNDSWYIFAIGTGVPPADWMPQPAAAPPAERPAAESERALDKEITDAFGAWMSAFLQKNADGALAVMADEVSLVRMNQTVSRDELRTAFQGYFAGTDFGGTRLSDVADAGSIFVEPSSDLSAPGGGDVYALNLEARKDLSDEVPFWTTYQRYYFAKVDGDWKIIGLF